VSRTATLTRRERQIMDVLYASGRATAAQVRERMPDPPSYSAVRALLRILEEKGHARHEQDGPRYVYVPAVPAGRARRTALTHLVRTFFQGSAERAVAAILESSDTRLTEEELNRLEQLIEQARRKGT
jgi:predicted transcriptional regulator